MIRSTSDTEADAPGQDVSDVFRLHLTQVLNIEPDE